MTAPAGPLIAPDRAQRVAVIGVGTVGTSMAMLFASQGLSVSLYDADGEASLRAAWTIARAQKSDKHLVRAQTLAAAVDSAQFVFEAAPERLELKQRLYRELDEAADPGVVIASATSSLLVSDFQRGLANAQRVMAAHPFNPPHLVPLIEISGGEATAEWALAWTHAFFVRCSRKPIRLRREAIGHIANRLSAALYREAVSLVEAGVASVEDIDDAVRFGPGLRWAVMGPHLLYHLAAGDGGYARYLDHLGPAQEARWKDLGRPKLSAKLKQALVAGVEAEARGRDIATLSRQRDQALIAVLEALSRQEVFADRAAAPHDPSRGRKS